MNNETESTAEDVGSIYILTNEGMPGLCKIGSSALGKLDQRIDDLSNPSGVPFRFKCVFSCDLENYKEVEADIHKKLDNHRVNPKREFFEIDPELIIPWLEKFKNIIVTTNEVNEKLNKDIDPAEQKAEERYIKKRPKSQSAKKGIKVNPVKQKTKKQRRPPFNFKEMGIKPGRTITFEDGRKKAKVLDEVYVEFNGKETRLSPLTQKLLKSEIPVAPLPYWEFKGKRLSDYYDETYPKE